MAQNSRSGLGGDNKYVLCVIMGQNSLCQIHTVEFYVYWLQVHTFESS